MISAIVLAAGKSRRMGAEKLLLPLDGKRLIARIVDEVLESPVDEVLVVVGSNEAEIKRALAGRQARLVVNPDAGGEMLSSVRCGLAAASEQCRAVLVVLGDQPGISRILIADLVRAFRSGGKGIVVPTYGGRRGHPILFSVKHRDEVLHSYDDVGLRGLSRSHPDDVLEMQASTAEVLEDMDVPEDYRRMLRRKTV
jgi:molybdenum cofactor cytidylyltransferase